MSYVRYTILLLTIVFIITTQKTYARSYIHTKDISALIPTRIKNSIRPPMNKEISPSTKEALSDMSFYTRIAAINKPTAPFTYGKYTVFIHYDTHEDSRVFIAFSHEQYTKKHNFVRIQTNPKVLAYVVSTPFEAFDIRYRLIVNSSWTYDTQNPHYIINSKGIKVSVTYPHPQDPTIMPSVIYNAKKRTARFYFWKEQVFQMQRDTFLNKIDIENVNHYAIYIVGNFTAWDPFLLRMQKVSNDSNLYFIDIPIQAGTYHYYFQLGNYNLLDPRNAVTSTRSNHKSYVSTIIIPQTTTSESTTAMIDVVATTRDMMKKNTNLEDI